MHHLEINFSSFRDTTHGQADMASPYKAHFMHTLQSQKLVWILLIGEEGE
jgi:hypothetical protein